MTLKITADNIDLGTLTSVTGPKITLVDYPGDDLATTPAGGATVAIAGTGFVNGCQVLVDSTYANTVTFVSSTSISFTTPAMSAGTYPIYVINPDGGTAIAIPGVSYSGVPAFATTSGSLGTVYEGAAFSSNIAATSDSAVTYSIDSGALPAGFGLNANTGAIAGNVGTITDSTTYNFTIKATDVELQDTTRNFSITTSPDVVTFNTPAGNQTYSNSTSDSFSLTLDATSVLGRTISYTANTLPTGLTLSGNVISGTFSTAASVASLITATAATSLKTATRLLTWAVTSPTTPTVEYLVVAGGGGGGGEDGNSGGGGGGAGGFRTATGFAVTSGSAITVTVGAGGSGTSGASGIGSNSVFSSITSLGGGSGGTYTTAKSTGSSGGSGGGGGGGDGAGSAEYVAQYTWGPGGAGTAGQGNAGGSGKDYTAGGGGGGAGAAGSNASGYSPFVWPPSQGAAWSLAGNGGSGLSSSMSGTSTTYAGGGGGGSWGRQGSGGSGGGGTGGTYIYPSGYVAGTSGSVNTGGGGGGGGGSGVAIGKPGGSGIVIIRYSDSYPLASATTGSPTVTTSGGYRVYQWTSSGSITF